MALYLSLNILLVFWSFSSHFPMSFALPQLGSGSLSSLERRASDLGGLALWPRQGCTGCGATDTCCPGGSTCCVETATSLTCVGSSLPFCCAAPGTCDGGTAPSSSTTRTSSTSRTSSTTRTSSTVVPSSTRSSTPSTSTRASTTASSLPASASASASRRITTNDNPSFVYNPPDAWSTQNNTTPGCSSRSLRVTSRVGATVTFPVDAMSKVLINTLSGPDGGLFSVTLGNQNRTFDTFSSTPANSCNALNALQGSTDPLISPNSGSNNTVILTFLGRSRNTSTLLDVRDDSSCKFDSVITEHVNAGIRIGASYDLFMRIGLFAIIVVLTV